ncbi:hypothetical protein J2T08_000333 [Neorhizobium galegae]|uniref:hypothetical protein n=1 Tax=Neorhizobium TaxID=1525371 RepID=UPI000CFA241C|nr:MULTISPECIES: hypothetical protein [Neorhizobium]MDQ0132432.1 hypothetical protein [Neorhizobium galegae]
MNDNDKPSYTLTFDDAIQIWLRHWNGEFQNRIAGSFDVNPARVNEVLKERKHVGSRGAALAKRSA